MRWAGIFLCTYQSVSAQSLDEEETIKVGFSVYSLTRPEGIRYFDGEESKDVSFFSSSRSNIYEYEGDGTIYFFRETPAPTEVDPSAVSRKLVGQVTVPSPGGEYLFVFFPVGKEGEEFYRVFPLADSRKDLPPGSVRMFNATRWNLFGVVDGRRMAISPGPSEPVKVSGETFQVGLAFQENGKVHQGFNGPLSLDRGSRGVLFVFPPFVKGSAVLQVRFLNDGSLPEPREEATIEGKES